jgi:hypothetical protein
VPLVAPGTAPEVVQVKAGSTWVVSRTLPAGIGVTTESFIKVSFPFPSCGPFVFRKPPDTLSQPLSVK